MLLGCQMLEKLFYKTFYFHTVEQTITVIKNGLKTAGLIHSIVNVTPYLKECDVIYGLSLD